MRTITTRFALFAVFFITFAGTASARYESRFEIINFDPVVDGGDFLTIYDTQTHDAWQGNLGFTLDYANQPLQILITGVGGGTQSIVDNLLVADLYGSVGFTDWFTAGLNVPVVLQNWFVTDDALAQDDRAAGMGDLEVVMKFRFVDIDEHKVGVALIPSLTLPTGDVSRYTGNGAVTGGVNLAVDFQPVERFHFGLNLGAVLRDEVDRAITIAGGLTGTIHVNHQFTYGLAGNFEVSKNVKLVAEIQGSTVIDSFFQSQNNSPVEADAALRYIFNDSGFAATLGGGAGILDGIGNPRFRAFAGLNWTSPPKGEAPVSAPPEPRIVENKIILMGKIFYDTAKSTIKPESYPILDDVVDVLNKNANVSLVEIQGHCDSRGGDAYNMRLSDARAHSARNYLMSKGIEGSRLTARGYGETQPIASNSTAAGMSQNRRTEFVIREKDGHPVADSGVYVPSEPSISGTLSASPNGVSVGADVSVAEPVAVPETAVAVSPSVRQASPYARKNGVVKTPDAQLEPSVVPEPVVAAQEPVVAAAEPNAAVPQSAESPDDSQNAVPPYGQPAQSPTQNALPGSAPAAQPVPGLDAEPIPQAPSATPVSNLDTTEGVAPSELTPISEIKPQEFPTAVAMN